MQEWRFSFSKNMIKNIQVYAQSSDCPDVDVENFYEDIIKAP